LFVYEYASGALNYTNKNKDSEHPPAYLKAVNNPFNKFQYHNYHVFNIFRKKNISKNENNLSDLQGDAKENNNSLPLPENKPVIIYSNAETDNSKILSDNKGKTGIYQWTL
jgi:hypothetical protein